MTVEFNGNISLNDRHCEKAFSADKAIFIVRIAPALVRVLTNY